jgi:hypothetical protein
MIQLIPYSVTMRKLGYVLDTTIRGFMRSQWVSRGALQRKKIMDEKVDRVVHILEKFAKIVSRKWRVLLDKRAEIRKLHSYLIPLLQSGVGRYEHWGNIMYEEDLRKQKIQLEIQQAYFDRLVAMPDAEWVAHTQRVFRQIYINREEIQPWIEIANMINRRRLEARKAINENKAVWTEIKPKKKIRSGRFDALEDIDEE